MPLFGTDGIRGAYGVYPVTTDFCQPLVRAVCKASEPTRLHEVLLGQDTRDSGAILCEALKHEFLIAGVDVKFFGVVPSPALAYLVSQSSAQLALVVTASHNPATDNGFKFFDSNGQKFSIEWERQVELLLGTSSATSQDAKARNAEVGDIDRYLELCRGIFAKSAFDRELTVVVDCANGATSYCGPQLFTELGLDVKPIGIHQPGKLINDGYGSTIPTRLQQTVLATKADLGIAFDGDGDRMILVDEHGEIVDGDSILALLAIANQAQGHNIAGVVGTTMTNGGIDVTLAKFGISITRVPVGDRNVAQEMRTRGWHLGGEASGHMINFKHSPTGDGLLTALQVLQVMSRERASLRSLLKDIRLLPQVHRSVTLDQREQLLASQNVIETIRKVQAMDQVTRVVVRPSGTEPVVRVMVEGHERQQLDSYAELICSTLQ